MDIYSTPDSNSAKSVINCKPGSIAFWLACTAVFFFLINLLGFALESTMGVNSFLARNINGFFNLNNESNIPAFFSSVLMLFAALLLCLVYLREKQANVLTSKRWLLLGLLFMFLAVDENVEIHEKVGDRLQATLGSSLPDYLQFAWVLPYIALLIGVTIYFLPFVLRLPKTTRNLFVLSGFVFATGAVGFEMMGSYAYVHYGWESMSFKLLYCVEELLEMSGVIILVYTVLDYLKKQNTLLSFSSPEQSNIREVKIKENRDLVEAHVEEGQNKLKRAI